MFKLISINIEREKHHDKTLPFLKSENPDAVCLQEIFQKDVPLFEKKLNYKSIFRPMCYYKNGAGEYEILGVAILAKDLKEHYYEYIVGSEDVMPKFVHTANNNERNIINIVLLSGDISYQSSVYRIATTHFTWTPEGISTEYQKEDVKKLITALETNLKEFVLVGDLNAPRGMESFSMLSQKFKDNIPVEYISSIDPKLHRAPGLSLMVDGLFSTRDYEASEVRLVEGISDHKAVVCMLDLK